MRGAVLALTLMGCGSDEPSYSGPFCFGYGVDVTAARTDCGSDASCCLVDLGVLEQTIEQNVDGSDCSSFYYGRCPGLRCSFVKNGCGDAPDASQALRSGIQQYLERDWAMLPPPQLDDCYCEAEP